MHAWRAHHTARAGTVRVSAWVRAYLDRCAGEVAAEHATRTTEDIVNQVRH